MPETWTALARWPGRLRWLVGGRDDKFATIRGRSNGNARYTADASRQRGSQPASGGTGTVRRVCARRTMNTLANAIGAGRRLALLPHSPRYRRVWPHQGTADEYRVLSVSVHGALHDIDAAGVLFFAHLFRHAHDAYEAWMGVGFSAGRNDSRRRSGAAAGACRGRLSTTDAPWGPVYVLLTVAELGRGSFKLDYRFQTQDGDLAATAHTVHVCVHPRQRPFPTSCPGPCRPRCVGCLPSLIEAPKKRGQYPFC